jgi:sec-independent protein translocase protein TatA
MHSPVFLFLNIGSSEMVLIVFVALLLFGGEKLPEIARGLGKGIRDFKDASEGVKREINNQINNYEEKREEDKRVENAITANQAAQNQLPSHPDALVEGHQPVANTMPVNDNLFVEDKHAAAETHAEAHVEPAVEVHAESHAEAHSEPASEVHATSTPIPEPTKNAQ